MITIDMDFWTLLYSGVGIYAVASYIFVAVMFRRNFAGALRGTEDPVACFLGGLVWLFGPVIAPFVLLALIGYWLQC